MLVGASGGGLIGGISLAVKEKSPATQIWSVEPAGFDDLARSLQKGAREKNAALSGSICDALLAATPGELTFEMAKRNLAGGLSVTDEEAKAAVRFAFRELKLVVEPGGAVSLAAILAKKLPFEGKTVAAVLSGGNIDPAAVCGDHRSTSARHERAGCAGASAAISACAFRCCLLRSSSSPAPTFPICPVWLDWKGLEPREIAVITATAAVHPRAGDAGHRVCRRPGG